MISPQTIKVNNETELLKLVLRAGYLRAYEAGLLMRPKIKSSSKFAERVIRSLISQKLLLSRELPQKAGRVFFLSISGVKFLEDKGIEIKSVTRLQRFQDGVWVPPLDWEHHLIAVGIIANILKKSKTFRSYLFEKEIRESCEGLSKIPDGYIYSEDGRGIWLEVENSRKNSNEKANISNLIVNCNSGIPPSIGNIKTSHVLIGFNPAKTDNRGYSIDHFLGLNNALKYSCEIDAQYKTVSVNLLNFGVRSIEIKNVIVNSIDVEKIVIKLNSELWYYNEFFSDNPKMQGVYFDNWGAQYFVNPEGKIGWEIGDIDKVDGMFDVECGIENQIEEAKAQIAKWVLIRGYSYL